MMGKQRDTKRYYVSLMRHKKILRHVSEAPRYVDCRECVAAIQARGSAKALYNVADVIKAGCKI